MVDELVPDPPARLRSLLSWQASKMNTVGSRLTATQMPLSARAEFAVLAALDEYGTLSQADLGRYLGLDRNDVNGVVGRLRDAGHLSRETDLSDRRRNIVTLNESGQTYLDQLQTATDLVQTELSAALTPAEIAQLQSLLTKLLQGHKNIAS
ncbi:MarR family winged helix-turn-helix transcriptional regulator [Lacisediminihabitans sp. H27-G8]|uniref:MarR family winged helix-turn-helix transcriptional regulator n=1 Tax=Lacisediminihabitans sp. H27-G8 TaxID=3111909 RepID=UPI0038FCC7C1